MRVGIDARLLPRDAVRLATLDATVPVSEIDLLPPCVFFIFALPPAILLANFSFDDTLACLSSKSADLFSLLYFLQFEQLMHKQFQNKVFVCLYFVLKF